MSEKVRNTLKMMGVSGKDSVLFADAYSLYHLTINQKVKQQFFDQMFNTVIMDKTFKQWLEHFIKGKFISEENCFGQKIPANIKDYKMETVELVEVDILLSLVLQEFYKKEKVIG